MPITMRPAGVLVIFALVFPAAGQITLPGCAEDLDFPVCTHPLLMDAEACDRLIKAAEKEDGHHYDTGWDSIDGKPAMQIDIMENEQIRFPKLYEILEPTLEKLNTFISQHFDTGHIYWVFFRRYSADGNNGRKSVGMHNDRSGATVITILNDGFEGGKYRTVRKGKHHHPVMEKGTAMCHDGELEHMVEPVTNGTRYSLIVFFTVGTVDATFVNDGKEAVDVSWVDPDTHKEVRRNSAIAPGESGTGQTYPGHIFRARNAAGDLVTQWTVRYSPRDQSFPVSQSFHDKTDHSQVGCMVEFVNDGDTSLRIKNDFPNDGGFDIEHLLAPGDTHRAAVRGNFEYIGVAADGSVHTRWRTNCAGGETATYAGDTYRTSVDHYILKVSDGLVAQEIRKKKHTEL